jgi:hypothetical protein
MFGANDGVPQRSRHLESTLKILGGHARLQNGVGSLPPCPVERK